MTNQQTTRLSEIQAKLLIFSSEMDTSTWEATFFLNLLQEKNVEITELRSRLKRARRSDPRGKGSRGTQG